MKKIQRLLVLAVFMAAAVSCKKETPSASDNFVPVVFVHGYSGSGDSYTRMIQYFLANGYPASKLYTYDWNTLDLENAPNNTAPLDEFIRRVKLKTGADKVNLVGHSLGGSLTFNYCSNPAYAANVNRLAWLAPYLDDRNRTPDAGIPTLNLRSDADYVVTDTSTIPGATNLVISGKDHNEIASCEESFTEIYKFFNEGGVPVTVIPEEQNVVISGKVVSFIENYVSAYNKVEIYEVRASDGTRIYGTPDLTLYTDENGYYEGFYPQKNSYYEFQVSTGRTGDRPIHFYFEPFRNSSHVIYLRTFPPQGSLLNIGFNAIIPFSAEQAVSINFCVSQSVLYGRDALTLNGYNCVTPLFTAKEKNTLAFFMFDNNRNSVSDYTSVPLFSSSQSFKGIDLSLPAGGTSTYVYNGRTLHTFNWPSSVFGLSVAMFY